ncbi:hypothetical protein [Pedobacter zeae]|uniref:Uncharacterized protein n=1 Tax=Pedobacter zeae TaxID=1737356 RepID=A0A7W6K6K3_9SPHI|nr:hypothetical protein [Pedobacter zeae]MBB4106168.1 hypothetical protein [Pedobacter zeae]GGG99909.1 hypothetical protein GCM10007422_12980 [Pedobacter zeae]
MEQFKDFFADLKERVSSPLISSFVISWLLINWPITVGLLLYKQQDLKADGFRSYYELIKGYSNWTYTALIPFLLALIYTFAFPYLKAWIKLLNAKIDNRNETNILRATSEGSMPVKKYIELRETHADLTTKLRGIIEDQSVVQTQRDGLLIQVAEFENMVEKLEHYNESLKNQLVKMEDNFKADLGILRGRWEVQRIESSELVKEEWLIEDNLVTKATNPIRSYVINNFMIDKNKQLVALHVIELVNNSLSSNVINFWFKFDADFKTLVDKSNRNIYMNKV